MLTVLMGERWFKKRREDTDIYAVSAAKLPRQEKVKLATMCEVSTSYASG
jgi:hypothetical protein